MTLWLFWAAGSLVGAVRPGLAFAYLLSPAVPGSAAAACHAGWGACSCCCRSWPRWCADRAVGARTGTAGVQVAQQLPVLFSRLADWLDRLRSGFLASNRGC